MVQSHGRNSVTAWPLVPVLQVTIGTGTDHLMLDLIHFLIITTLLDRIGTDTVVTCSTDSSGHAVTEFLRCVNVKVICYISQLRASICHNAEKASTAMTIAMKNNFICALHFSPATTLDLYSLSQKTHQCKIWQSIAAASYGFRLVWSLWNLTSVPVALLSRRLLNSGWCDHIKNRSHDEVIINYVTLHFFIVSNMLIALHHWVGVHSFSVTVFLKRLIGWPDYIPKLLSYLQLNTRYWVHRHVCLEAYNYLLAV